MYRCFLCVVILFVAWQYLLIKLIVIVVYYSFLAGVLKASMPLCLPMDR